MRVNPIWAFGISTKNRNENNIYVGGEIHEPSILISELLGVFDSSEPQ
uniref:Uncharacterized protein n=1 Tax=Rhizophora mucronata TaxID=61149 RepID=A0A2P2PGZ0_RHIMU